MIIYVYFLGCTTSIKDTSTSTQINEPTTEPSYEDSGFPTTIPFNGTVSYEDGTEVTAMNTRVQMCSDYCYPAVIGSNGNFAFAGLAPATYAFDVVPIGESADNYATPLDFTFTRGSNLTATRVGPGGAGEGVQLHAEHPGEVCCVRRAERLHLRGALET